MNFINKIKNRLLSKISYKTKRKIKAFFMNLKYIKLDFLIYSLLTLLIVSMFLIVFYHTFDENLKSNLIAELVGVVITVFLINGLIAVNSYLKWKRMEKRVTKVFKKEISSLFTDISNICGFGITIVEGDIPKEQLEDKRAEQLSARLKELTESEVDIDKGHITHLLKEDYGTLFNRRKEFLNNFESKYSNYLKTDVVIALIDIQEALENIDLSISVYEKFKNAEGVLKIFSRSDKQISDELKAYFHDIIKALKIIHDYGYLKTW